MTPFLKFIHRMSDKWFGKWYEGPEPPARMGEMLLAWAEANPRATREEWLEVASRASAESYRSGYVRGYEHAERVPTTPSPTPDEVADAVDPGWREREGGISLGEGDLVVPVEQAEEEMMVRAIERANGWRP